MDRYSGDHLSDRVRRNKRCDVDDEPRTFRRAACGRAYVDVAGLNVYAEDAPAARSRSMTISVVAVSVEEAWSGLGEEATMV